MRLSWIFADPSFSPVVSGGCVTLAAIYLIAGRCNGGWSRARSVAYVVGLGVIAFALQSGVASFDDRLLSMHMIEHILLLDLAPPLLLLGEPARLALLSLPRRPRRAVGRTLTALGRRSGAVGCLLLSAAMILLLHVPVVFDTALAHPLLHALDHLLFVVAGVIMWWPILGRPNPRRIGPGVHVIYLTTAMLPMAIIGAYLNRATSLFYPVYGAPARALGVSALTDQQNAGAIMLVAGTAVMGLIGLFAVMAALLGAERRQQARELYEVLG
ncbi:MAG TPA: cytochrome c oxidase assembly protein [Solirubrobacteraceae bacterium]|nr:cytochrome c oxidase assembly protein [Solirubrobacteraceae bacterium]